jgi:molecular chaperone DnaJ
MRLRLAGEGEPGDLGGPAGDLFVVLSVRDHDTFARQGADLHREVRVSAFQAMLGDTVTVCTIDGEEESVRIEAGSQPGDMIRLRGRGIPRLNSSRRGDLFLHLNVVIPRRLTPDQRTLVAQAADHGDGLDQDDQGGLFERFKKAFGGDS